MKSKCSEDEAKLRQFLVQRVSHSLSNTLYLEGISFRFGPHVAARIWNPAVARKAFQQQAKLSKDQNSNGASSYEYLLNADTKL